MAAPFAVLLEQDLVAAWYRKRWMWAPRWAVVDTCAGGWRSQLHSRTAHPSSAGTKNTTASVWRGPAHSTWSHSSLHRNGIYSMWDRVLQNTSNVFWPLCTRNKSKNKTKKTLSVVCTLLKKPQEVNKERVAMEEITKGQQRSKQ